MCGPQFGGLGRNELPAIGARTYAVEPCAYCRGRLGDAAELRTYVHEVAILSEIFNGRSPMRRTASAAFARISALLCRRCPRTQTKTNRGQGDGWQDHRKQETSRRRMIAPRELRDRRERAEQPQRHRCAIDQCDWVSVADRPPPTDDRQLEGKPRCRTVGVRAIGQAKLPLDTRRSPHEHVIELIVAVVVGRQRDGDDQAEQRQHQRTHFRCRSASTPGRQQRRRSACGERRRKPAA